MEKNNLKINLVELEKGNIYSLKIESFLLFDYIKNIDKYNIHKEEVLVDKDYGFEESMNSTKKFIQKVLLNKFSNNSLISDEIYFCDFLSNKIWTYIINYFFGSVLIQEYDILKNNTEEFKEISLKEFIRKITNRKEWIIYVYEKYPVLFFLISNFIEEQLNFINEIISNYKKDINILKAEFNLIKNKIIVIDILKGDPHYLGKSVSFIQVGNKKIVYKPRALSNELLIANLLKKNGLEAGFPKMICKGEYGYSSFISNNLTSKNVRKSGDKTIKYFNSLGKNCKIFHTLQIEDVISDNVIWDGDKLNIIDLECFHIPPVNFQTEFKDLNQIIQLSPIQTGVISNKLGKKEYNMSLMFENNHYIKSLPIYLDLLINKQQDKLKQLDLINGEKNLHLPDFYKVDESNYFECIDAFIEGYKNIKKHNIEYGKDFQSRIILRETQTYFDILIAAKHPENLISSKVYKSFLAIILGKKNNTLTYRKISNFEFQELLKNHIPIFYVQSEKLYSSDKKVLVENYYKLSERFLNTMTKTDYTENMREILLSTKSDKIYFDYFFKEYSNLSINSFSFINMLNSYLKKRFCYYNSVPFLLNLFSNVDSFKISNKISQYYTYMEPGLIEGSDGVAISLLKTRFKDEKLINISSLIINYNFSQIQLDKNDTFSCSVYDFPLSTIVSKIVLEKKTNDKINDFIISVFNFDNINYGFTNGISSLSLFIKNNINIFKEKFNNLFFDNLLKSILTNVKIKENMLYIKDIIVDKNTVWDLNSECLGLLIILNSTEEKFINNKDIQIIKNILYKMFYSYWDNNIKSLNKKISWQYGRNGLIAFMMSLNNKKANLILNNFFEQSKFTKQLITQNFSLNSGTLGTLYLYNKYFKKKKKYTFGEILNISSDNFIKKMGNKGLYSGLFGFYIFDSNFEVIIPNERWFKI